MPKRLHHEAVPLVERQTYLSMLACFSNFSKKEIAALAALMDVFQYASGEHIVEQDTLVDSFFIIVQGQAEVIHDIVRIGKFTKKKKILKIPVATLNQGEAVGLNDTGFYSTTGKRTATVIALTNIILLKIDLIKLHEFFRLYPNLKETMYQATDHMLRLQLIKQSLPFSRLSHERLQWLSDHIDEITVLPGDIIFKQGDVGEACYLIRSGSVQIEAEENDKTKHQLATLYSPALFGEATWMTKTPRNATARAIEKTELLVLRHIYLTELVESEKNVANMFMTLMVDRSRPLKNPHVSVHYRKSVDGQTIVILKNQKSTNYLKLSREGWFIWQQLDGKKTVQELTMNLAEQYNIFAPDVVVALIAKLSKGDFLVNLDITTHDEYKNKPFWIKMLFGVRKILEARVAIGDVDQWLTTFYHKCGYVLFSCIGRFIIAAIALSGLVAFFLATPSIVYLFKTLHSTYLLFILLIPFTILSVILHELGHALATKYFGFEVHYMGVGWYWLAPIAFTDTSDMWLATRWPRLFVNLAGVYTDSLTAGISVLLMLIIPNLYVRCFLWIFALYTYINAFRNLSPLQDLDGYYALMDLFDKPKLRRSAVVWLIHDALKTLRQPRLLRNHLPELFYWVACVVFLICISLLTLLIQGFVFALLGIHSTNPLISLMIPFLVVIVSSLGIIADIRNEAED